MQDTLNNKDLSINFMKRSQSFFFCGLLAVSLTAFMCIPATSLALSNSEWTSLGPAPVSQTATPDSKTNLSGRITGIAAHPANAGIIYVASGGGGVWKTTDGEVGS